MRSNWKWFLTGVAVPLLIAAVTGLFALASSGKARIEVVADSSAYTINPKLRATFDKVRKLESSDELSARLKAVLPLTTRGVAEANYALFQASTNLSQAFTQEWDVFAYSLPGSRTQTYYYAFRITNRGSKTASSPSLQTNTDGYYRLSSPEVASDEGEFSNAIKLPNLKPGTKTFVEVWTNYDLPQYNDTTGTVSYDEGVAHARFPIKVYGRLAAFFDSPGWWFPVFAPLLLVLWASFMIGRYAFQSKETASSKETVSSQPRKRKRVARRP